MFRPDITEMVDWVLNTNYLPTFLIKGICPRLNKTWSCYSNTPRLCMRTIVHERFSKMKATYTCAVLYSNAFIEKIQSSSRQNKMLSDKLDPLSPSLAELCALTCGRCNGKCSRKTSYCVCVCVYGCVCVCVRAWVGVGVKEGGDGWREREGREESQIKMGTGRQFEHTSRI